ncbi:bax inhibitor 1, putative [Babesia caballi]|uniref:Bax inhibitor 1, putative n=1 Tax=Babesia caballi TaxID=5871 RepID=A0AAV4LQN6_BABCB|nr:bax inhibitor 1, putative [Babesia caballi]
MIDVGRFFSRSGLWTLSSLLDFSTLSKAQKDHLAKVYGTLAGCTLVTLLGTLVPLRYFNWNPLLVLLGCTAALLYVTFTAPAPGSRDEGFAVKRVLAMGVSAFAEGLLLRQLLHVMFTINPEIVTTALFGTIAIFACFSLGSLLMASRTALYLGSLAFSLTSYVALVRLTNIFVKSRLADDLSDIVMLVAFCGFVIFDTQITLTDFDRGSRDVLAHALMLYCDVMNIFVKLIRILYEKEKKKEKE